MLISRGCRRSRYGFDGQQRGDVWSFHVDGSAGMWEELTDEQSGDIPQARSVFAATRMSENEIFLFGGEVEASTCPVKKRPRYFVIPVTVI